MKGGRLQKLNKVLILNRGVANECAINIFHMNDTTYYNYGTNLHAIAFPL